jgi:putative hydrolase of the HAD superfamily
VFLAKYRTINERLWLAYRNREVTKQELVDQRFYLAFRSFGYDTIEAGREAGQMYLELSARKTHLFPGAKETLAYLADHYAIHILTNGFKAVQEGKVENCGLTPYVTNLITSDDAGFQKPDKRIFDYAFEIIGTSPKECLMIGDDEKTDIKGAQNAGVDYIWFNPKKYASAIENRLTVSELSELVQLL